MAITLRHDTAGIGGNAAGGGGSQSKFGQALVLQQQRASQENAQRMQDRLFELGRMRLAGQFQFARDNEQENRQRRMFDEQRKIQLEDRDAARKIQLEDRDAANQQDFLQQNTINLEQQVGNVRRMMAQNQFTPEGQKITGELVGALRAIEQQRDTIRPKEYNKLLNKWLENAEKAGLDSFVAPVPTLETEMQGRFKDLGNGYGVILQPDGKMEVREIDPTKIAGAKGMGAGVDPTTMSPLDYFKDEGNYESARKKAMESLMSRYEADNPDATAVPTFDESAVQQEMLREFNTRQQFLKGLSGGSQGGNAGASPPAGQPPSTPPTAEPAAAPEVQQDNPYVELQEQDPVSPPVSGQTPAPQAAPPVAPAGSPGASVLPEEQLSPSSKGAAVPDFDAIEEFAPDEATRREGRRLKAAYDMAQNDEVRNAIGVIASKDASKEDLLRAIAALKRNGVNIEEVLKEPPPPRAPQLKPGLIEKIK